METLQIHLFGSIQLYHGEQPARTKLTRSITNLLAFLLIHRNRPHPREVLAGLFWGNQGEEKARNCLSTALWRLRQLLEPEGIPKGTYLLTTSMGEVGYNWDSDYWLDIEVFENEVTAILNKKADHWGNGDVLRLEYALDIYKSELLEGFYEDWAVRERERLRLLLIKTLMRLMHHKIEHEAYEDGLIYGQKIIELDPLREEIHREMMRLWVKSGRRSLAIRQYETCSRLLAEELDIPPMEETQRLYHEIIHGGSNSEVESNPHENSPVESGRAAVMLDSALQNLNLVAKELEKGQKQLRHSLKLLQRFLGQVSIRKET